MRSKDIIDYYWKRFLRLFPGLFTVLFLTVIFSSLVYEGTVPYFANKSVWTYIPSYIFFYQKQDYITGVFENNPFKSSINGSLWTIPYEVLMYMILSSFIFLRKNKWVIRILLLFSFTASIITNVFFADTISKFNFVLSSKHLLDLSTFFIAGSLLASINFEQSKFINSFILLSSLLFLISLLFNSGNFVIYFLLPIIVIGFGSQSTPIINNIKDSIGDISYGVYIYGFPVQQTLVHLFGLNYLELMSSSLIITSILAYMSWHLIESKALKLKRFNARSILQKYWSNLLFKV